MHFVYIIYSKSVDKYYIGETHDVEKRVNLHNQGNNKSAFTTISDDWKVALKYDCKDRQEALFLERFSKRMKSRRFIKKVVSSPSILSDILSKNYLKTKT
jgi:putative endonuclease